MNPEWCLYNYFPSAKLCLSNCCWINLLLQVIEYVQFLQEKVQKYEGSYQGWSSEPTKLMPWVRSYMECFPCYDDLCVYASLSYRIFYYSSCHCSYWKFSSLGLLMMYVIFYWSYF